MLFFCRSIYCLLPPISMLLVIAAALTFAGGQLASAETRARATSWATAMVVGALFGFVLVAIFPPLIDQLYYSVNTNAKITANDCTICTFEGGPSGGGGGGGGRPKDGDIDRDDDNNWQPKID
ncbi:MAG: hypothetical protein NC918_04495 [Candidatus Omnitrophica bacterium]|nr:hypothetical protein [Candidatus Omnitrophota bacterium]